MKTLIGIARFVLGVIGIVFGLISLLIAILWILDVRADRKHIVVVKSETPFFAGGGDEACGGTQLTTLRSGTTLRVRRIRYWKNCATIDIALPDGRSGHVVLGQGDVTVSPPLE